MNVFVVNETNGYEYEDEEIKIVGVFKTFRGAFQHLLDKGFVPYAVYSGILGGWQLMFEKKGGMYKDFEGWIEEHTLQD